MRSVCLCLALIISLASQTLAQLQLSEQLFRPVAIPSDATPDELYSLGTRAYQADNYRAAVELLRRSTELAPRHKKAWVNLGRAYMMLDRFSDAETAFRRAIEVNPFDEWAYNNLGRTLNIQGREDEAVAAFRKHLEINPLDKYAHQNIGKLRAQQGDCKAAIEELEVAQKIDLWDDGTRYLVACYRATGRLGDAADLARYFRRELQDPIDAYLWNTRTPDRTLAWATSSLGRIQASIPADPEEKFRLTSTTAAFWAVIGQSHMRKGDLVRAESYLRAAWILTRSTAVAEQMGRVFELRKQWNEAAVWYALSSLGTLPNGIGTTTFTRIRPDIQAKALPEAKQRYEEIWQLPVGVEVADGNRQLMIHEASGRVTATSEEDHLRSESLDKIAAGISAVAPAGDSSQVWRRAGLSCMNKKCVLVFLPLPADILDDKYAVTLVNPGRR
jgi:Flp pilus assembly protein TadD